MYLSKLDKAQWISVLRNTVFAALSAAIPYILAGQYNVGASAAIMAGLKVVEKLFTPVQS